MSDNPQLSLLDIPEDRRRIYRISRRAARKRLPVLQAYLPVADDTFKPVAGVPGTRAQCPDTSTAHCPHVRCKWHLFLETGEHRAGRPGLANVPRDARGLTLPSAGAAGQQRPGTTLRPAWLHVRGLELEREVLAYVSSDQVLHEVRNGTFDYWSARLHVGEAIEVYDNVTVLGDWSDVLLIAKGSKQADGSLLLDRELPEYVVESSDSVLLRRVRRVSSCALDEIEKRGEMSNEQVGDAVGRHRTLVGREVKRATGRAVESAARMGMSADELMAGIRELRRENGRT